MFRPLRRIFCELKKSPQTCFVSQVTQTVSSLRGIDWRCLYVSILQEMPTKRKFERRGQIFPNVTNAISLRNLNRSFVDVGGRCIIEVVIFFSHKSNTMFKCLVFKSSLVERTWMVKREIRIERGISNRALPLRIWLIRVKRERLVVLAGLPRAYARTRLSSEFNIDTRRAAFSSCIPKVDLDDEPLRFLLASSALRERVYFSLVDTVKPDGTSAWNWNGRCFGSTLRHAQNSTRVGKFLFFVSTR